MAPLDLKAIEIGFVPGTGRMSLAIATHCCRAGLRVLLGSRDPRRAAEAASKLQNSSAAGGFTVEGMANEEVAAKADLVVWSPRVCVVGRALGSLEEREALLRSLAALLEGKIIVDVTNILNFVGESAWGQTSSTLRNQDALGVPARWTTAFKATFARVLEEAKYGGRLEGTMVAGDDNEAVDTTIALVNIIPGFVGIRAGGLQNTKIVELLGPPWLIELDELNGNASHASGWQYGI